MDTNHSAMAIVIEHYAETNGIDRFYSLPDHSVHAGPSTPDFKDFEPVPTSICGASKPRSDTVASGTKVRERKCFCGLPSVVGRNREDRAFINCAAGSCKFFRWADSVLDPPFYNLAHTRVDWRLLSCPVFTVYPQDRSQLPEHIVQGSLGDCWFLSALTVVCEEPRYESKLLRQISDQLFVCRLCKDGLWTDIEVDSYVPVFKSGKKVGKEAFAQAKNNTLFGPIVEKAYACMYGSYASIHGGQISEALFDLTGCPTETLELGDGENIDLHMMWARLRSWKDSGFLVGCATSSDVPVGEEDQLDSKGLVTLHAYSVTDLVELHDVAIGKQLKMTDFIGVIKPQCRDRIECLRLVQIRNPWGKREWTGDWGGKSDKWTKSIIDQMPSYAERDLKGKFWMELGDFVHRFSEIEVAKTHQDWFTLGLRLDPSKCIRSLNDVLETSSLNQTMRTKLISGTSGTNWCYITLIHPSVRKIRTEGEPERFYPDIHMILHDSSTGKITGSCIGSTDRVMTLEVMLSGHGVYELVLFTMLPTLQVYDGWTPTIRVFSASPVEVRFDSDGPPVSIPVALFERLLVDSVPVVEQIQIGDSLSVNIHSTHSLSIFSSVYSDGDLCGDLNVNVVVKDKNLQSVGRWRRRLGPDSIGQSVLGIITQIRTRYASKHARLGGYEFDIELIPSDEDPTSRRRKQLKLDTEVIELD